MAKKLFLYFILALALVFSVSAVGYVNIVEPSVSVIDNPGAINGTQHITVANTNPGTLTLSNIAMSAGTLTSGANTIDGSAVTFWLNPISLDAGTSSEVAVIATIPPTQKAGTYLGVMTASHNASHQDTASLNVTVNEVPSYSATATSLTVAKGMTGYMTVNVTNTGNADISDLTYTVSTFTSTSGTMSYSSLTAHPFLVSYGTSRLITIGFSPSSSQPAGVYSGQIAMSYRGANVTLPLTLTVRDPLYSLSMPEVVYPASERNVNVTQTVTITNTGDYALTGITLAPSATNTWQTGVVPSTLAAGDSFSVTLMSTVPEDADSGLRSIGTLVFTSNQLNSTTSIKTNAISKLSFDSVKVSIADGSWRSVSNGSTVSDDARPGDTFVVKVKIENLFTDNEDIDIDDVEVTALFKGAGEDGDDIDDDTDSDGIKAGKKSSEWEINFDDDVIDWEATSGKLEMELIVTGDDDNGATHTAVYIIFIEVKRDTGAEIVFTRFSAQSTVQCGNSIVIYADGRSVGEDSEDEVVLKIQNDNLGIDIREAFSMGAYDGDEDCDAIDEGEDSECREFTYSKAIQIPAGMAPGTYTLLGKLYTRDGDEQTDDADIDLNIECRGTTTTSTTTTSTTTPGGTQTTTSGTTSTTTPTTTTTTVPTQGATTSSVEIMYGGGSTATSSRGVTASMPTRVTDTTQKKGFGDSGAYIALLSLLSVLLIIGIIVTLVVAFTKPRE